MGDVLVPEVWRCPPARPGWMGGKRAAVGNLSPLLPPSRVLRGGGHGRATGMSQSWPTRCIRVGCGARSVVDRRQTLGSSEGSHSQSRRAACGVHSLHLPAASEPESRSESVTVGTAATPWARRPCKGPGVVTARGSGRSDGWPGAVTCDGPRPAGPCRPSHRPAGHRIWKTIERGTARRTGRDCRLPDQAGRPGPGLGLHVDQPSRHAVRTALQRQKQNRHV